MTSNKNPRMCEMCNQWSFRIPVQSEPRWPFCYASIWIWWPTSSFSFSNLCVDDLCIPIPGISVISTKKMPDCTDHLFSEKSSYFPCISLPCISLSPSYITSLFVILPGFNHFITVKLKTLIIRCIKHVNIMPINSKLDIPWGRGKTE